MSTAIFGDGGAAVVLVGDRHPAAARAQAAIADAESVFFRGTTHLMGFHLRNQGLQIVLDRGLAPFVRREVLAVVEDFLRTRPSRARTSRARSSIPAGGASSR